MAHFVSTPDTFTVEERPAYLPTGEGPHTYLWIEKRDLTTIEAVRRIGRALGIDDRGIGYAGMKDRHATTRQWISVPDVAPERALELSIEGLRVLEAKRHGNKLRVGHTHGNRFEVVLQDVNDAEAVRIEECLRTLAERGMPNRYGHQRFGAREDNAALGVAVLRGEKRERDHRKRRLLLSALQSAVFNQALRARAEMPGLGTVLLGDVLQKVASGGLFVTHEPAVDQARVDAGELVVTGPMPGGRATDPPPGTPAFDWESAAFATLGVTRDEFRNVGRDLPGARRALLARVEPDVPAVVREGDRLRLRFSLPAGSYATVLIEDLGASAGAPVLGF